MHKGDGLDSVFEGFFGKTSKLFTSPEQWTTKGNTLQCELEIPGVDPKTVRVQRFGGRIRAEWTDRLGAVQKRSWEFPEAIEVRAHLGRGILTITVWATKDEAWHDVEIQTAN